MFVNWLLEEFGQIDTCIFAKYKLCFWTWHRVLACPSVFYFQKRKWSETPPSFISAKFSMLWKKISRCISMDLWCQCQCHKLGTKVTLSWMCLKKFIFFPPKFDEEGCGKLIIKRFYVVPEFMIHAFTILFHLDPSTMITLTQLASYHLGFSSASHFVLVNWVLNVPLSSS